MLIDGNDSSSADCYACLLELQLGGIALSARRDQHRIGGQDRPGGKLETHGPGFQRNAFLYILFPVELDPAALKRAGQCPGNLCIQKR